MEIKTVAASMAEIKTIIVSRDRPDQFDEKVNNALENGFILRERYTLDGWESSNKIFYPILVAELERYK